MHVVATAGHVDHGKSTLVRALTGMEPDRWAEERRRGMTIDLGYAWTECDGETLAFVDVPGHERFIGNMLAGVGPVPAALLVIAADQGWQAQTEEHVAALEGFAADGVVVALTRCDLTASRDCRPAIRERLRTTFLAAAPVVEVAAPDGTGLDALRMALATMVRSLPPPDPAAPVRLWIDRRFTIQGAGTVVTGTLTSGGIGAGDRLLLHGEPVVVRQVQSLGRPVDRAAAVARVALNLRAAPATGCARGDVLVGGGGWRAGDCIDVRHAASRPLPGRLMVHAGTAAVEATVRPLDARHARLRMRRPLPLVVGDRIVLRDPGDRHLWGAVVLDPAPPVLARRGDGHRRGAALARCDGQPDAAGEVARRGAVEGSLLRAIGVPVPPLLDGTVRFGDWLVSRERWATWQGALVQQVEAHRGLLSGAGIPLADAAQRLGLPDRRLVQPLVAATAGLTIEDGRVRPAGVPGVTLEPALAHALKRLRTRLDERPFQAPEQGDLIALGLTGRALAAAVAAGGLLRLPGEVLLAADAPQRAADLLRTLPEPFTVSQARQALDTTRRVAVPLLEHLDRHRITRLQPDGRRVMIASATAAPL